MLCTKCQHEVDQRQADRMSNEEFVAHSDYITATRPLARLEFYMSLGRRAPTKLISVPSYVHAVKRHYKLVSGNQARAMLAEIEGFSSWHSLMAAMLRRQ